MAWALPTLLHGVRSKPDLQRESCQHFKMDLTGIPTPKMDWDSTNLPEAWKKFQHVQLIFDGPLKDKDEEIKCKYLLLWVGDKGRDVFNTWPELSAEQAKTLNVYFNKFKSYVQPKLNPVFARYKFNNILQNSDTTEQFVTRLKLHVQDCNPAKFWSC